MNGFLAGGTVVYRTTAEVALPTDMKLLAFPEFMLTIKAIEENTLTITRFMALSISVILLYKCNLVIQFVHDERCERRRQEIITAIYFATYISGTKQY